MQILPVRLANLISMTRYKYFLGIPPELVLLNPYSMSGQKILNKLYILGRDVVRRGVPGDFVECGVCNGGSAAAIALALRNSSRYVWLYDSFEGMPPCREEVDGSFAARYTGSCKGTEEKVKDAFGIAGFPEKHCIIRKGLFKDTFQAPRPQQIAFLHIDADWYDNVTLVLDTFYDLVMEGGLIVLDDFGCWEGCREAFYDFVTKRKIKPLLERAGFTQAFWIKGREHNREFRGAWEIPPFPGR